MPVMDRGLPISAILLFSLISCANTKPNFFVVAPNQIRVDEPTKVHIFGDNLGQRRTLDVTIQNPDDGRLLHSTASATLIPGKFSAMAREITLRVHSGKLGSPNTIGHTYVLLTARCPQVGFAHSKLILVAHQTGIVFLQTDKPIYTPRQNVHLRIFTLKKNRKAHNIPMRVEIKNPDGVIVMERNTSSVMGISHLEFQVPDPAKCGEWSAVTHHGYKFSQSKAITFKVAKYVLPHFNVQITQPHNRVITSKTQKLDVIVSAMYSFGAPVVGEARVHIWVKEGSRDEEIRVTAPSKKQLSNGKANITINITEITSFLGTRITALIQNEAKLRIDADVTETSGGVREMSAVTSLDFANTPYVISTERIPWSFSPGMTFYFQVQVFLRGGGPATDVSVQVDELSPGLITAISTVRTDANGRASFLHDIGHVDKIELMMTVTGEAGDQTTKRHTVLKNTMKNQMTIGESRNAFTVITVRRNDSTRRLLHYMLISGGQTIQFSQQISEHIETLIMIKKHLSKVSDIRIVVWYVASNGNVVSTSKTFDIEAVCEREVSLTQRTHKSRLPGDTINLKVVNGPEDGEVALLAVDKAVYYLSSENLLTRSQMFNSFGSMDSGCGYGGGQTAHEVFELAGLTVLSDAVATSAWVPQPCTVWYTKPNHKRKRRHVPASSRFTRSAEAPTDAECCNLGNVQASHLVKEVGSDPHMDQIDTKCRQFMLTYRESKTVSCLETISRCCARELFNATEVDHSHGKSQAAKKSIELSPTIRIAEPGVNRDEFPESFLIETVKLDEKGEFTKAVKLPDTITTWFFTAVSMSKYYPMCVSRPHQQLVKKNFFLKLSLPYDAVLGEQLEIRATVYNTGTHSHMAKVKLLETEGLCCAAKDRISESKRIQPGSTHTFTWLITPSRVGQVPVSVELIHHENVTRTLTIIPAGLMVSSKPVSIALNPQSWGMGSRYSYKHTEGSVIYKVISDPETKTQHAQLSLKLPPDAIDGTHSMTLGLTGEMIADVVEAFMTEATHYMKGDPPAYGEESMAKLGPTVCAARYTNERLTLPKHTADTIDQGVRGMLAFRTKQGAFGLFGSRRRTFENIWLTAFTVRTLSTARPFSSYLQQQPDLICKAVSWLLTQKNSDGTYSDWRGIPTLYFIRDQPDEKVALTAYVLIALLEAGCDQTRSTALISDTISYLAKNAKTADYHYTRVITTYALAKSGHPDAYGLLDDLLKTATTIEDRVPVQKFWKNASRYTSTQQDIETAAYGVATMVVLHRFSDASPFVEWLMSQRRPNGLFPNSQTTVVGLQALTDYSLNSPSTTAEMNCHIQANHAQPPINYQWPISSHNISRHFSVTSAAGGELSVVCTGQGAGRLTLTTSYYSSTDTATNQSSAFHINVTTNDECNKITGCKSGEPATQFSIRVCTRAAHSDVGRTIIDVGIPTGYAPTNGLRRVQRINTFIEEYTRTQRAVIFYVSNMTRNTATCIKFTVMREHNVKNIQPVPIKVQDYYNPERVAARFYRHTSPKDISDRCPSCYGYEGNLRRPPNGTLEDLRKRACSCLYDYVFEGKLVSDQMEDDGRKLNFSITAVAKEGFERMSPLNEIRTFIVQPHCFMHCNHLELNRKYFIMGQEMPQTSNGRRQYYVTANTYLVQKGNNRPDAGWERTLWKHHKDLLKETNICFKPPTKIR